MSSIDKDYISIYILECPVTKTVKYIGQSNNLKTRYLNHCNLSLSNNMMYYWIDSLKMVNEFPIMTEVKRVDTKEEANLMESEFIAFYSRTNILLNVRLNDASNKKYPYPINYLKD